MGDETIFGTGEGLKMLGRALDSQDTPDDRSGQVFGSYQVVGHLGSGGMGRVFRAKRSDGTFERDVAIKVLHAHPDQDYVNRFDRERRILASLQHPHIAQLYDAGVSEDGELFLVMELVEGIRIDSFAEQHSLNVRQKARLMLKLCEALGFAHSKLVIHRDIKPTNVLVDTNGQVKLLDFGISKILEAPDDLTVDYRPMTPRYASPEQWLDRSVSVASDIYQVGLLLVSLFRQKANSKSDLSSAQLARAGRSVTVGMLVEEPIPKEMKAIINRCLQFEASLRYESAFSLAADLRNFLGGYPVSARNPGVFQRFGKFVRRNWLASGATVLTILTLSVSLIVTLNQVRQTVAARDFAEHQQARAERTTSFLVNLFESNLPSNALGRELSAKEILERGEQQLNELEDEPELKAELLDTVAMINRNLGNHEKALKQASEALAIKRSHYQADSTEIANTLGLMSRLHEWFGNYDLARDFARQSYEVLNGVLGFEDERTLDALYLLATANHRIGDLSAAEVQLTEVLRGQRLIHGENHPSVTTSINNLASLYASKGDYQTAAQMMEEVMAWNEIQLPADHPWIATDLHNYGSYLREIGRYDDAIETLENSLRIRELVQGRDHPLFASTQSSLANAQAGAGRLEVARRLHYEAVALSEAANKRPHPMLALTLLSRARILTMLGDLGNAETDIADATKQLTELGLLQSTDHNLAQALLADVRRAQGRYDEALAILGFIDDSNDIVAARDYALPLRANIHRRQGNLSEAASEIDSYVKLLMESRSSSDPILADAYTEHAQILYEQERLDAAVSSIRSAIDIYSASFGERHWKLAWARIVEAQILSNYDGGFQFQSELQQHVEELKSTFGANSGRVFDAEAIVASILDPESGY